MTPHICLPTRTRQHPPPPSPFTSFHFIFSDTHRPREVLAGEATGGLRLRGRGVVLLVVGQMDSLLVHPLGLHPLDETEEVLVRHCRGVLARFRRGAALVVDPGRLRQRGEKKKSGSRPQRITRDSGLNPQLPF